MKRALYVPNFGAFGHPKVLMAFALACERAGWDGFFLWDHLQWPGEEPAADPWVTLGAIASGTTRICLGPLVTPVPRRDLPKLARETASVAQLAEGRLRFGAGLGWKSIPEWEGFGHETNARTRGEMLDEGLDVLDRLWRGEAVDHRGQHYQVECEPFAEPASRIPVWIGGSWPAAKPVARAARWDGMVPISPKAMEGGRILPEDVYEIRRTIDGIRAESGISGPFDIVVAGGDSEDPGEFEDAGVTWLITSRTPWGQTVEALLEEIEAGPAGA
jgi:alkanesulfonate monooxygenase SsuD/methylene tetrahydromethanopterin reductase-like flavin-dependent oxidoreductase (luciferase family)